MDRFAVILHVAFYLAVLVAETCPSSSWAREILYRPKRQVKCESTNQFRCTSGECIDRFSVCDGTKECSDGTDETESICKQLNIKCPPLTFQCAYGACIDGKKKCNGVTDCADESDEKPPACTTIASSVTGSAPSNCKNNEKFACKSGQCIDEFSVCDGKMNCDDGSDETTALCANIKCPNYSFRCSYGGCVDAAARCNGIKECADNSDEDTGACKHPEAPSTATPVTSVTLPETREGCRLPQQPESGSYTPPSCELSNNNCSQIPGSLVPQNWLLSFKCNDGYYINGTTENKVFLFCNNGKWSDTIPVCRKMCSPLISLSVDVRCWYQGESTDCSKPMRPGTRASGRCKQSYEQIRPPLYKDIICTEYGQWSYVLFYCQPACGKRNFQDAITPLIINGQSTKHGEFPWHAGLYKKNTSNLWEQICGGSLISPHIVLTAAHCVYEEKIKKIVSPTDVKVGLGKYYREWTHDEPDAIKTDVRKILIPPNYYGRSGMYAHDIALLDFNYSIQISTSVMPVCVDWNLQFMITPGMSGTLAGWGKTRNETPSDVLLYTQLPYIDYGQCLFNASLMARNFLTNDKFCARFINGSGAAQGDSGGGLTFLHNDLHYVYGIVSTQVKAADSFMTFTNISNTELRAWLNDARNEFDREHPEV